MSTLGGPRIVQNGLVLSLDAADRNCYSGSGTVARDLSGSGNDGTLVNGVGYNIAKGGSLDFSGGASYVSVNVNSWIRTASSAYTLSSFFYYNEGTGGGSPYSLMTFPNDTNANDGFWQHLNIGGAWLWRTEDNVAGELGGTVQSSSPFSDGNWYHLVTIVKTNSLLFYLNGNLNASISTTFSWSNLRNDGTAYVYIGTGYGELYQMTGYVSNFSMYNRELTSTEVSQTFNSLRGRFGI